MRKESETELQYAHYMLEFPDNVMDLMGGTGSLKVDLEVNTEIEGQILEYRLGPRYEFLNSGEIIYRTGLIVPNTNWEEAESHCVAKGGHLATITSEEEKDELFNVIPDPKELGLEGIAVWLGGKRLERKGNWTWVNGKEWEYEDWHNEDRTTKQSTIEGDDMCLQLRQEWATTMYGAWTYGSCTGVVAFPVCEFEPDDQINGIKSMTLTFRTGDLHSGSYHMWWKSSHDQEQQEGEEGQKIRGFTMKWKIENKFPDLILTSNSLSGEISTPSLEKEYDEELYKSDRRNTFLLKLNLPQELNISQNYLNVQLVVNLGESEGWDEVVEYRDSPQFVHYPSRKTFEDAEATCVKDGGHLASVTAASENEDVVAMSKGELTWLGGTYNATQESWSWLDGKSWRYDNFEDALVPVDEQKIAVGKKASNYKWTMMNPPARLPFICRPKLKVFRGVGIHSMNHALSDLPNQAISVVWNYRYKGKEVLAGQKYLQTTGFRISWYTTNVESKWAVSGNNGSVKEEWKNEHRIEPPYKEDNEGLVSMANMVQQAQELGIESSYLQKELALHKEESLNDLKIKTNGMTWESGLACPNSLVSRQYRKMSLDGYVKRVNLTVDIPTSKNVSFETMRGGFLLYASLLFCPPAFNEAIQLTKFSKSLIGQQSPSTLIQALTNTFTNNKIEYAKNKKSLGDFYLTLSNILDVRLKDILMRKLSSSAITVLNNTQPFLSSNEIASTDSEDGSPRIAELSSHPVHLVNKDNIMFPSAFIPFCAYKTNMELLGRYVDGLRFPVCDKFVPTILDGELCYSLDVDQALPAAEDTTEGPTGQLTLLLDYNSERSIHTASAITEEVDESFKTLNLQRLTSRGDDTSRIFINLLASYSGEGSGSYIMSTLKMMTATDNFLAMSEEKRGCKTEEREECKKRIFLESGPKICGCIPWELASQFSNKVIISYLRIHLS